ncbi:MAG: hypothetical protein NZO16_01220 [Deltaproteobacteria bacterium]|nr:hypothetical protein [Deltaproteobacteria bacterium]
MNLEEQFKSSFYGFIEKVQEVINSFMNLNSDENPMITQSVAKIWFLLEGLNSYLEIASQEGIDFQLIDVGIDMIAEELFKPHIAMAVSDISGIVNKYKSVKSSVVQLSQAHQS